MREKPSLTVDGIIIIQNQLVLIKRARPPFEGHYALPGGFVEYGETVEKAIVREVKEETGLTTAIKGFSGIYSAPDRDPRGHTISLVFELEVIGGKLQGGDDASEAKLFPLDSLPSLAFDHDKIISDFLSAGIDN